MKRLALAIALAWATGVSAESLTEWKTPGGKLYFGDRPPAGSVAVKKVEKQVGITALPASRPDVSEVPKGYAWRDETSCGELTFKGVTDEPFQGISRHTIRGTVTHEGNLLVKNVKVCGPGVCDELRAGDSMVRGDKEDFRLNVEGVPSSEKVSLRIECSIREPA